MILRCPKVMRMQNLLIHYSNLNPDQRKCMMPVQHLSIVVCYIHVYNFKQTKQSKTRKQSEPADLRQGHVVCQVAAP